MRRSAVDLWNATRVYIVHSTPNELRDSLQYTQFNADVYINFECVH